MLRVLYKMDNYYRSCPAKMSDGRFLADYNSSATMDAFIMKNNRIYSNNDYRKFLQDNGVQFTNIEWKQDKEKNGCPNRTCIFQYPTVSSRDIFLQERRAWEASFNGIDENCPVYSDYRLY